MNNPEYNLILQCRTKTEIGWRWLAALHRSHSHSYRSRYVSCGNLSHPYSLYMAKEQYGLKSQSNRNQDNMRRIYELLTCVRSLMACGLRLGLVLHYKI